MVAVGERRRSAGIGSNEWCSATIPWKYLPRCHLLHYTPMGW